MDSAGSGGREILFQTGPSHAWLANVSSARGNSSKYDFNLVIIRSITRRVRSILLLQPWLRNSFKWDSYLPIRTTAFLRNTDRFQVKLESGKTKCKSFDILWTFYCAGLDLGQAINGFIYHTKYDRIDVIPRGSIQNTGDNVLSLVRALANAPELLNIQVGYEHVLF